MEKNRPVEKQEYRDIDSNLDLPTLHGLMGDGAREGMDTDSRIAQLTEQLIEYQQLAFEAEENRASVIEWMEKFAEADRFRLHAEQQLQLHKADADKRVAMIKRMYQGALKSSVEHVKLAAAEKMEKERLEIELEQCKKQLAKHDADDARRWSVKVEEEAGSEARKAKQQESSKALIKSNVELVRQVIGLQQSKTKLETDINAMLVDMKNYQHWLAESRAGTAMAMDRAAQAEQQSAYLEQQVQGTEFLRVNALNELTKVLAQRNVDKKMIEDLKAEVEQHKQEKSSPSEATVARMGCFADDEEIGLMVPSGSAEPLVKKRKSV